MRRPRATTRSGALLTFIVVGGGPTGVELAGAMSEIVRRSMPLDFRRIDTTEARIILFEGEPRLLPAFPESLSERAARDLRSMGVEVALSTRVTQIDSEGVVARSSDGDERRIDSSVILWAAGVRASSVGAMLGAPTDKAGRVRVREDLSIPGHPEVFVVGDLAATEDEAPGLAPAAMQMGRYAGGIIADEARAVLHNSERPRRAPFRYRDKGMLATIGRSRAVAVIGGRRFTGFIAWSLWLAVHIYFLIGFRNRLLVMFQWAWAWLTFQRGARLITPEMRDS